MRLNEIKSNRLFNRSAFTLVELLVVIAIIVILTGLTIGLAANAKAGSIRKRAQTELKQLETAIDIYFEKRGYYPPDNPQSVASPPLFYELTGTYLSNNVFYPKGGHPSISKSGVQAFFNIGGFQNSDTNPFEVESFFKGGLTKNKYAEVMSTGGQTNILLTFDADGPPYSYGAGGAIPPAGRFNPWRYQKSTFGTNVLHNAGKYDLWTEVIVKGKTEIIGNWKQD